MIAIVIVKAFVTACLLTGGVWLIMRVINKSYHPDEQSLLLIFGAAVLMTVSLTFFWGAIDATSLLQSKMNNLEDYGQMMEEKGLFSILPLKSRIGDTMSEVLQSLIRIRIWSLVVTILLTSILLLLLHKTYTPRSYDVESDDDLEAYAGESDDIDLM